MLIYSYFNSYNRNVQCNEICDDRILLFEVMFTNKYSHNRYSTYWILCYILKWNWLSITHLLSPPSSFLLDSPPGSSLLLDSRPPVASSSLPALDSPPSLLEKKNLLPPSGLPVLVFFIGAIWQGRGQLLMIISRLRYVLTQEVKLNAETQCRSKVQRWSSSTYKTGETTRSASLNSRNTSV